MAESVLQTLFQVSASIHLFLFLFCLGSWLEWYKINDYTSYRYEFYRPRVAGERRLRPGTPIPNASATARRRVLSSAEANSSFIDDLTKAYSKTCPEQASPPGKLLILQTSPHANLGLNDVIQTWMPVTHNFLIFSETNGWFLLTLVFSISCAYQLYFYDRTRRKKPSTESPDESYFERPCFARWMEYALTSPLQILLIASSVMIRDVYTVMLLVTAQLVCVLLGFAVECAMAMHADNKRQYQSVATTDPIAFNEAESQVDQTVQNPKNDPEANVNTHDQTPSIPHIRLWFVCFLASAFLHMMIWYIFLNQLWNVELETECQKGPRDWVLPLKTVIYGQCLLFSLFALVPLTQQIRIQWYYQPVDRTFYIGSVAYAILSVTAKLFLGGSYIAFVVLFPFETGPFGPSL